MRTSFLYLLVIAFAVSIYYVIAEPSSIDSTQKVGGTADNFELSQNYPNPFNPITVIHYKLPEISIVKIEVCDLSGNNITTIITKKPAGDHSINFDGSNLASGVYLYRVHAGEFEGMKKMVLLR